MAILRFLGRLLIVTVLISSAYHHLVKPEASLNEFQINTATLNTLLASASPDAAIPTTVLFMLYLVKLGLSSKDIWSFLSFNSCLDLVRGWTRRSSVSSVFVSGRSFPLWSLDRIRKNRSKFVLRTF